MGEGMYRTMYPTGCTVPKFYGLPKIHKTSTSLRSFVSSRGSVTYGVAKVLAKVLKPLVDKLPNHIQSTMDFVNRVREVTLLPRECLNSYNVSALFTSVPINLALNIIKDVLEHADKLWDRSVFSVQNIIELLGSVCTIHTSLSKINSMNRLRSSHGVTSQPYSCHPVRGAF